VLTDHLLIPTGYIEREVFPDSEGAKPMKGLIRS